MLNFGIRNVRRLDGLRQKVKECTIYKNGEKESKTFYDSNGEKLKTIHYSNGNIDFEQIVYFENGFPKSYTNYSPNGIPKSNGEYILDNQGQILEKYFNGQLEEKYRYDNNGLIAEILYANSGSKNFYEYDENDLAIKLLAVQEGFNLFGGPKKQLTLFVNDDLGNIVSFKTFNGETNELLYSQTNEINTEGDTVRTIGKLANNTIVDDIIFNHRYENNGNWIERETINEMRDVRYNEQRDLVYF